MIKVHDIFLPDISYFPAHFLASTSTSVSEVRLHLFTSNTKKKHRSRVNPRWSDIETFISSLIMHRFMTMGKFILFFPLKYIA